MKTSLSSLFAAALAAALNVSPAVAGGGHDHGPRYGGVVREVRSVAYELVARPDSLTLYVSDHGRPIVTQGAIAEAVVYAGNERTTAILEPAGDNRMVAQGSFRVGVGTRVVLTATLAGKPQAKASFKLK